MARSPDRATVRQEGDRGDRQAIDVCRVTGDNSPPMKNPPHVGALIRREMIEPLGLTVTAAARALKVGRPALRPPQ